MPPLSSRVIAPRGIARWEYQPVKAMPFLLVRKPDSIRNGGILIDRIFHGMGRNTLRYVRIQAINHTLAVLIASQPEYRVIKNNRASSRYASLLDKPARDAFK